jgi:nucleoside-diphosphate-sugar epimerase
VLISGAAGFVGYRAARQFLARGDAAIGIDNPNECHEVSRQEQRDE